jgi:hypothetical protein
MRSTRTLHTPLIQTEHLTAKTPAVGQDRPYRIVRLTGKQGAVECDHEEGPGQSSGMTHSGRLRVELFVKNHETGIMKVAATDVSVEVKSDSSSLALVWIFNVHQRCYR